MDSSFTRKEKVNPISFSISHKAKFQFVEKYQVKRLLTPTEKDGKLTLFFEFDGLSLVGKTVVVFESLYYEGVEIAVHADIEDEAQSVNIIDIRTSVKDKDTGTHTATLTHTSTFIDTVSYEGLTPGKSYTVYGKIMMKSTGKVLQQKGIPVTGMTEFVPETPAGTVEVIFVLDTFMVEGEDLVVFEDLFAGSVTDDDLESEVPIASHADLEDKDQTIKIPVIPFTPPHTGVDDHIGFLLTAMLTSGAGVIWILRKRKRRGTADSGEEDFLPPQQ
ncbi:MAG: VaFE repeat-containing surface-anchored protein [Oscillospiraceae bacterium]|nr:VaFE repeat-containing surface-anchored protein [Oscillospiraceae bacterium]MBR0452298.1 VaFE repeat-containing surface-anchored protein [Oscillospiraceae bacterium]